MHRFIYIGLAHSRDQPALVCSVVVLSCFVDGVGWDKLKCDENIKKTILKK